MSTSGWKWLDKYRIEFLKSAPVLVVVVGDPKKTGVDQFMEDGSAGYQYACAAAVQNMMLAAQALGIGSLWFTLFDKNNLKQILRYRNRQETPVHYLPGKAFGGRSPGAAETG